MDVPPGIDRVYRWTLERVRRISWRDVLRALPVVIPLLVLATFMVRNLDTPDFPNYEIPEGFTPAPPPVTDVGAVAPALAGVEGTTSTVLPPNVGRSRITGVVIGPGGPVPGAIVRIERALDGGTQAFDIATGVDGRYSVPGIGGGRYRVRAFLPPTLAVRTATVFFLPEGEERGIDLIMEEFLEPTVSIVVAPDPPLLEQSLNLVVQVVGRSVDPDGFVRVQPLAGAFIDIATSSTWTRTSAPSPPSSTTSTSTFFPTTTRPPTTTQTTDVDGRVSASFRCVAPGSTQVQVMFRATLDAIPRTTIFDVASCIDPATTTTTTVPGATASTTGTSLD